MSKKINKSIIDNAKAPSAGDAYIWDSELQGFGVRVQASGRKTYVVRYRARDGKSTQRKMTLARCSDVAPDRARDMARKIFSQVADGIDPAAERKPAVKEANDKTVGRMFAAYIDSMRAKKRESADEVERALLNSKNNAADALGRDTPAADVIPTQVVAYVSTFYLAGHRAAADKHRGYIASAYTWAMKSANDYTIPVGQRVDWDITRNPATDIAKDTGATKTRDRNLSAPELRQVWLATAHDEVGFEPETAACIRLLICCGQRVQETLRIEGKDIDLKEALWNMPTHKTKGKKRPHTIPLPKQAVEELAGLIALHGDGYLFPSRTGAKSELICHRSVLQSLDRWRAREDVNIQAFQTRDIRRTWKSRAHDAGVDRFTRDLIQQHAKNDTGSKNYDRSDYLPQMREAMTKWEAWLEKVTGEPAPVIQIAA
jgi:integrase